MAGQSSQLTRKEAKTLQQKVECGHKSSGMKSMHESNEMSKKK